MAQLCDAFNIKHNFTSPYMPQSNGKTENSNKFLKASIRKLCQYDKQFSTIDKYQILEFGSIIIYLIYRDTSQVLTLLVGQNDPQQCRQTRMLMLPNVMMFIECPITRFTVHSPVDIYVKSMLTHYWVQEH